MVGTTAVDDDVLEWGDGNSIVLEFEGPREDVDSSLKGDSAEICHRRSTPPIMMCWARPQAQSQAKPSPFEPDQACPRSGLHAGFGLGFSILKPEVWA